MKRYWSQHVLRPRLQGAQERVREPHVICPPCTGSQCMFAFADPVHHFCGHLQHSAPQKLSLAQSARAVSASGTDDSNVDGVSTTHHQDMTQPATYKEFLGSTRKRFTPSRMVEGVRRAASRKFLTLLRKNKFVYNVRKASAEIVRRLI